MLELNGTTFITLLGLVFTSSGLWILIQSIYETKISHKYKMEELEVAREDAIARGVLAILHHRLDLLLERAILRKVVGIREVERIENLYTAYMALNGNGVITNKYNQVKKLEVIDDDTIEEMDLQKLLVDLFSKEEFKQTVLENLRDL